MNALGLPTFIYTLVVPDNINYDITYDLLNEEQLDPLEENNKILFMDGLSQNEENTYRDNLVYVAREFIKEDKKYLILSICPYKVSGNETFRYENIVIHINTTQDILITILL